MAISRKLTLVACLAVLGVFAWTLNAQPVNETLMEDVVITQGDGAAEVNVTFRCGMRYLSHFPHYTGDELRIRVKPALGCPADESVNTGRGRLSAPLGNEAYLLETVYEGEFAGEHNVTLRFDQQVIFEVVQGSDFRSLNVIVYPVE